jgi:hypothetical protein
MFQPLLREGRKHTTAKFGAFVAAIRSVLEQVSAQALASAHARSGAFRSSQAAFMSRRGEHV